MGFFFYFFAFFFWHVLLRVVSERNKPITFIFSPSRCFPQKFGWKSSQNVIFQFFKFFCYFFGIIYCALGRDETKRQYLISFFLGIFQPILALNEAILAFFNFFNFFAIFLEFLIMRHVGTERNYNFYFLSFSAFRKLFWLEMMP